MFTELHVFEKEIRPRLVAKHNSQIIFLFCAAAVGFIWQTLWIKSELIDEIHLVNLTQFVQKSVRDLISKSVMVFLS